jgi:hypothetical protein
VVGPGAGAGAGGAAGAGGGAATTSDGGALTTVEGGSGRAEGGLRLAETPANPVATGLILVKGTTLTEGSNSDRTEDIIPCKDLQNSRPWLSSPRIFFAVRAFMASFFKSSSWSCKSGLVIWCFICLARCFLMRCAVAVLLKNPLTEDPPKRTFDMYIVLSIQLHFAINCFICSVSTMGAAVVGVVDSRLAGECAQGVALLLRFDIWSAACR